MRALFYGKPKTTFCPKRKGQNLESMKYLSLEYIKQHSRIDYDCEDGLLEMYGDSAEETVAQYLLWNAMFLLQPSFVVL